MIFKFFAPSNVSPGSFAILIDAPSQSFNFDFKFSIEVSSVTSTS